MLSRGSKWKIAFALFADAFSGNRKLTLSWFQKVFGESTPSLLKHRRSSKFDGVYIGMAEGKKGILSRLKSHAKSKRKGALWTHFSFFEMWPNVSEIREIEEILREIYRKDRRANRLNKQRRCKMPSQKTAALVQVTIPWRRIALKAQPLPDGLSAARHEGEFPLLSLSC